MESYFNEKYNLLKQHVKEHDMVKRSYGRDPKDGLKKSSPNINEIYDLFFRNRAARLKNKEDLKRNLLRSEDLPSSDLGSKLIEPMSFSVFQNMRPAYGTFNLNGGEKKMARAQEDFSRFNPIRTKLDGLFKRHLNKVQQEYAKRFYNYYPGKYDQSNSVIQNNYGVSLSDKLEDVLPKVIPAVTYQDRPLPSQALYFDTEAKSVIPSYYQNARKLGQTSLYNLYTPGDERN